LWKFSVKMRSCSCFFLTFIGEMGSYVFRVIFGHLF